MGSRRLVRIAVYLAYLAVVGGAARGRRAGLGIRRAAALRSDLRALRRQSGHPVRAQAGPDPRPRPRARRHLVPRTDDTFVRVLEDELGRARAGWRVRAFNFGVSAYSIKEMVATLEHRMLGVEPDVVVLALIPADFALGRTPGIDEAGYLVHRDDSWLRAPGVRALLRSVHSLYLLRELRERSAPRDRRRWILDGELPESYRYVRRFAEVAAAHGIAYLIVLLPAKSTTASDGRWRRTWRTARRLFSAGRRRRRSRRRAASRGSRSACTDAGTRARSCRSARSAAWR